MTAILVKEEISKNMELQQGLWVPHLLVHLLPNMSGNLGQVVRRLQSAEHFL